MKAEDKGNKENMDTITAGHGGDWAGYMEKYGAAPIDFSISVSPLGLPAAVRDRIIAALDDVERYPDPFCRALTKKISEVEGVPEENIICGPGGADLIYRFVQALKPKRALIPAPTFSEYEEALQAFGCEVDAYYLSEENDFRLDDGYLDEIKGHDVVFLCEPNNPTDITDSREFLLKAMASCKEEGAILFVDECFLNFVEGKNVLTLAGEIKDHDELVILKSFTKEFAMAGIRLGYAMVGDKELLRKMRKAGQPWSVSYIAEQAGIAALESGAYSEDLNSMTEEERNYLEAELDKYVQKRIPAEGNFIMFKADPSLFHKLMEKGIMIRSCANYRGLDESWMRIGIRTHEDNVKLIDAVREISESEA